MIYPAATERFKPRLHAAALSNAVTTAWQQRSDALKADSLPVAKMIVAHAEKLYPAADMAVLTRYGLVDRLTSAVVRMHNGIDWSESASIPLPCEIVVPWNCSNFYCGGPRYSRDPLRGLKADYRAQMSEAEWLEHVRYQDEQETARLPEACEPFFARLAESRQQHRAEYRIATGWPATYKTIYGAYPKWGEIADQFAVLGAYLRQQWSEEAQAV